MKVNRANIHWHFQQHLDAERSARKRGYEDIAKSAREKQIDLIRTVVMSNNVKKSGEEQ